MAQLFYKSWKKKFLIVHKAFIKYSNVIIYSHGETLVGNYNPVNLYKKLKSDIVIPETVSNSCTADRIRRRVNTLLALAWQYHLTDGDPCCCWRLTTVLTCPPQLWQNNTTSCNLTTFDRISHTFGVFLCNRHWNKIQTHLMNKWRQNKVKYIENRFWNEGISIIVEYSVYDIIEWPRLILVTIGIGSHLKVKMSQHAVLFWSTLMIWPLLIKLSLWLQFSMQSGPVFQ